MDEGNDAAVRRKRDEKIALSIRIRIGAARIVSAQQFEVHIITDDSVVQKLKSDFRSSRR